MSFDTNLREYITPPDMHWVCARNVFWKHVPSGMVRAALSFLDVFALDSMQETQPQISVVQSLQKIKGLSCHLRMQTTNSI